MRYCTGRLPTRHDIHTFRAGIALARALAPLGAPPAISDDYVTPVEKATDGDWGMMGNDKAGCCTIADSAHQIMLHTANAGSIVIPTADQVTKTYFGLTGGQDTGLDETAVCRFMMTTGLCGQKSAGTAMIDPANMDHIRWAVQLFGTCRLGIYVTDEMMQDFEDGKPWTSLGSTNPDGHDVPAAQFDKEFLYVITWGKLQPVAWPVVANSKFLLEAHGEVYPDWIRANGNAPNGFNLPGLLAELPQVQMQ